MLYAPDKQPEHWIRALRQRATDINEEVQRLNAELDKIYDEERMIRHSEKIMKLRFEMQEVAVTIDKIHRTLIEPKPKAQWQ